MAAEAVPPPPPPQPDKLGRDRQEAFRHGLWGIFYAAILGGLAPVFRERVLLPLQLVDARASVTEVILWVVGVLAAAAILLALRTLGSGAMAWVWGLSTIAALVFAVASVPIQAGVSLFTKLPPIVRVTGIAVTLVLCASSLIWAGIARKQYRYFIVTGILLGACISLLVVPLAEVKLQGAILAFAAGIGVENITTKETNLRKLVGAVAGMIRDLATGFAQMVSGPKRDQDADAALASFVERGSTYLLWLAVIVLVASFLVSWVAKVSVTDDPKGAPIQQAG